MDGFHFSSLKPPRMWTLLSSEEFNVVPSVDGEAAWSPEVWPLNGMHNITQFQKTLLGSEAKCLQENQRKSSCLQPQQFRLPWPGRLRNLHRHMTAFMLTCAAFVFNSKKKSFRNFLLERIRLIAYPTHTPTWCSNADCDQWRLVKYILGGAVPY